MSDGSMDTRTQDVAARPRWRRLSIRMLGAAAPVMPGMEIDISARIPDNSKPDAVWHRQRGRQILQAHPEVAKLFGNTPSTAIWCLVFASAQIALAVVSTGQPFWLVLLLAYVLGGWINVNLFMLGHECNHGLVFRRVLANRWMYTLTTLPMLLAGHHTWWLDHPVHHNDMGATKDFIKRRRTFFLKTRRFTPLVVPYALLMITTQVIRMALGVIVYLFDLIRGQFVPSDCTLGVLAERHLVSGYRRKRIAVWAVAYSTLSLTMIAGLWAYGGWMPLVYLVMSSAFLTGFAHPWIFGMILSNSHFHGHTVYQPTSSYYGWLNKLTFNFGLHTEHHDLPKVPWSRLPQLAEIAPEFYDTLYKTPSYVNLTWKYHFGDDKVQQALFDNEMHRNRQLDTSAST